MRLSEESIKNVLDLLKKKLPLVYCSCGIERLSDLSRGIIYYNGKVKSKLDKDNDEFKNINTLLIFLDEIRDKNIIDIEKKSKKITKVRIKMNNVWYIYCGGVYFLLVVHLFSFS